MYVRMCLHTSKCAGWLTINAWPMLPTCVYLHVLHILYVTRAAYSLYDIPEMCSLEIQYLRTYIRTTYVRTYKYTLKKRYCYNIYVCMCYLCVTIISGYKIWRFSKIHDLAGISFSDFVISSSDTYRVLSGFPTVSSNDEPSHKADH